MDWPNQQGTFEAGDLTLQSGAVLRGARLSWKTHGTLSPARDNVILVCHALSGDAHAAGYAKTPPAESARDGFGAEDRACRHIDPRLKEQLEFMRSHCLPNALQIFVAAAQYLCRSISG